MQYIVYNSLIALKFTLRKKRCSRGSLTVVKYRSHARYRMYQLHSMTHVETPALPAQTQSTTQCYGIRPDMRRSLPFVSVRMIALLSPMHGCSQLAAVVQGVRTVGIDSVRCKDICMGQSCPASWDCIPSIPYRSR